MNKKAALVTGASQGLGLSYCKELLSRGYFVAALDLRISDELKELEGESLQTIVCDITDGDSVKKAAQTLQADKLDLIVNNAGVWMEKGRKKLIDPDFPFDAMITQYKVNAIGTVRIVREFMPKLLKSDTKTVVNMSSEAASIGECWRNSEYGYCMSKVAQNMATKIMSNDYKEQGVKFYAFHPGWMKTPQGYAGVIEKDVLPYQEPADTAKSLLDIALKSRPDGMYYEVTGREMAW